jgi:hypothetical protein
VRNRAGPACSAKPEAKTAGRSRRQVAWAPVERVALVAGPRAPAAGPVPPVDAAAPLARLVPRADAAAPLARLVPPADAVAPLAPQERAERVAPTVGLVAYFTFDEASGATAANTKDAAKSAKCVGTCTRPSGQLGSAFGIRNSVSPSDWIELPTGIFNGRSAITLSVWLRDLSTTRNEAPLLYFSASADEALYLLPDDNQASATGTHLVGVHSGTSFVDLSSATPVMTDKVWHQIVVSWNSAKIELFIDGNSVGSLANPKALPSQLGASSTNYLGRSPDDTKLAMFGEVDDLRIYDRALSAADVKALYKVR